MAKIRYSGDRNAGRQNGNAYLRGQVLPDQADKFIKEIAAVVRSRRRLRMILNGEYGFIFYPDPFNGLIIQIDMCNFHVFIFSHRIRIYAESMILGCNLTLSGYEVFYRVIETPVSMVHFKGGNPIGERQQLMPQTDSENRLFFF